MHTAFEIHQLSLKIISFASRATFFSLVLLSCQSQAGFTKKESHNYQQTQPEKPRNYQACMPALGRDLVFQFRRFHSRQDINLRSHIPPHPDYRVVWFDHECSTAFQESQERGRMPAVYRNSEKSQDITMPSLILPGVSRQIGRFCKKTVTDNNQVPCLPDIIPNSRRRLLHKLADIVSSQPTGGSSYSQRWQRTGPEMQQLRREQQHGNLLLFRVPEFSLQILF